VDFPPTTLLQSKIPTPLDRGSLAMPV